jgi:hypothetical protein
MAFSARSSPGGVSIDMDLEGVDLLEIAMPFAIERLGIALTTVVDLAAVAAVEEMQSNHPYTDRTWLLTRGMTVRRFGRVTRNMAQAAVTFEADYAGMVNDGTAKSRPYPFLPQGERAADRKLVIEGFTALTDFINTIGMG